MFNWTTTTILNSLEDVNGNSLVKVWTNAESAEGGKAGFSGQYPVIKIQRDHTFETRYITNVFKSYATNPVMCEMEVDCSELVKLVKETPAHLRLSFYITLEGSEESIYANDGYQKGKAFSIGFDVTNNTAAKAGDIAKKIKTNAEKYGVVMYGKKIFDITVNGSKLTIKGTHEYQRFNKAALVIDRDDYEDIVDYIEFPEEGVKSDNNVFTLNKRGVNGFGTYHQLIKDLRLPTAQNTRWLALGEDAKPMVGAKYNQYIITYCAPSMANPGFTVIGQHNMSVTTHVFWVNQAIDAQFNAKFVTDANVNVEEVTTSEGTLVKKKSEKAGVSYSVNHEQNIVDVEPAVSSEDND